MKKEITLPRLQDDVLTALKTWQNPNQETPPLRYLQRYRLLIQNTGNDTQKATNQLLSNALGELAVNQADEAELLRRRFLDGMPVHAVANRLNIAEATAYRKQKDALKHLAQILLAEETHLRNVRRNTWQNRLEPSTYVNLTGVDSYLSRLTDTLTTSEPPWIVAVEGLGGLGKTALADAFCRRAIDNYLFDDLGWVSAKQVTLLPGLTVHETGKPTLTADELINALLRQFGTDVNLSQSFQARKTALSRHLKDTPFLIVIDNLETAADIQPLIPLLRDLANPGKFLLTSRFSLRAHADVYCLDLPELSLDCALAFIRAEAKIRGIVQLADAPDTSLAEIHAVTGGNPLALKLVIGQTSILSLSQVLGNLREARGKHVDDLYTFIYWQVWNLLNESAQMILLSMPLAQDGILAQLAAVTELEQDTLNAAIEQLVTLSLVSVGGQLDERRYSIHRLTETFLLKEALKWLP